MERLPELLIHLRRSHSEIQIKHMMVTKGGAFCDYGAFRQSLRELHGRKEVCQALMFEIEGLEVDLEESRYKAEGIHPDSSTHNIYDKRRAKIDVDRIRIKSDEAERTLAERVYEFSHLYAVACALKDRLEEGGELTSERHYELEMDMWVHRWKLDAADEIRHEGKVSRQTLRNVNSLPLGPRSYLRMLIMHPQELLSEADQLKYELPPLPPLIDESEVYAYVSDPNSISIGPSVPNISA